MIVLHEFECIVSNGLAVEISLGQMQWDGVFSAMVNYVFQYEFSKNCRSFEGCLKYHTEFLDFNGLLQVSVLFKIFPADNARTFFWSNF